MSRNIEMHHQKVDTAFTFKNTIGLESIRETPEMIHRQPVIHDHPFEKTNPLPPFAAVDSDSD